MNMKTLAAVPTLSCGAICASATSGFGAGGGALLGRFTGVDRAANPFVPPCAVGRRPCHWPAPAPSAAPARLVRPKNRGPDQCAPVIRSAITVSDR